jgi:hypothetical protein
MELFQILSIFFGLLISIIGYFLRGTMQELKDVKEIAYKTKTKVEVLENDYLNKISVLNQKFDMLYVALDKLTTKIEELNKRID